ncbi:MAG: hypothetical protein IT441_10075 [Phycisphaeraceae bacterium]|nr:hypothetical protein [Phycisphaeraceae bacterium]
MHLGNLSIHLAVSGSWLTDMIPLLGVVLLATGMVMMYRSRRRRAMAPRITPQEQVERWRQEKGLRGDLEELMVEIEQLAKRMAAQLDAKAARIEQLLEEADQKVTDLERRSTSVPATPSRSSEPTIRPTTPETSDRTRDALETDESKPAFPSAPTPVVAASPMTRPDAPTGPVRVKTRQVTTPAPVAMAQAPQTAPPSPTPSPVAATVQEPTPPTAGRAGSDKPSLSRSVYQLADQNLSAEQIARQLGEHVGKVELILALRDA